MVRSHHHGPLSKMPATKKTPDNTTPESPETPTNPGDGASPLQDPKHEIYANAIAKGLSFAEAHEKAGYAPHRANVRRLSKVPAVMARVAWLQEQAAKVTVADITWIKSRLAQHAMNLTEVIEDKDGNKKPGPLFNASAGNRALELLGKEGGMFKDKIELGGTVQVQNTELLEKMTPEERAEVREILRAAAARQAKMQGVAAPEPTGVVPPKEHPES